MVPDPGVEPGARGSEPRVLPIRPVRISRPMVIQSKCAYTSPVPSPARAPKRKKPPRSPWVAPFLRLQLLLRDRSPPSGALDAVLGLDAAARLRAHAQTQGGEPPRRSHQVRLGGSRCEYRKPHRFFY